MSVTFPADLSGAEREAIQRIADDTLREIRVVLPNTPPALVLRVKTGRADEVIPETGENATTIQPNIVVWTVDPSRGVDAIVDRELRATLFHECHHLVRDAGLVSETLMDAAVNEGMATAFERDFAGADVPWGKYPDEVGDWLTEMQALPHDADRGHWLIRHPDGRRWIGMRVGTYLVDRASANSGRSPADLVSVPTAEVLDLAQTR